MGLLDPREQSALAQISVFRGGFSLGAAEAIVDLGAHEPALPLLNDALDAGAKLPRALRIKGLLARAHAGRLLGRLDDSRAGYEAALSLTTLARDVQARGIAEAGIGMVLREQGRLKDAELRLLSAIELLQRVGSRRWEARARVALGHTFLVLGKGDASRSHYEEALKRLRAEGDQELSATVLTSLGMVELAARPSAPRSHHVRAALRLLERALGDLRPLPELPAGRVLVTSPDARWCRLPDGAEVTFTKSRALRLMLLRLFDERLNAPGRALSIAALFESGWPGERTSSDAIENRVYVGLSRLRKMGFKGLLLSRDDGFLLDPATPAYRADKPL